MTLRRTRTAVVAAACVTLGLVSIAGPAAAEKARPGDQIKSPVVFPNPWPPLEPICGKTSLTLAKWISDDLKIDLYVVDKPIAGEKGYVDQALARLITDLFTTWAATNAPDLSTEAKAAAAVAKALADPAFQAKLRDEVKASLAKTGGKIVPSQEGGNNGRVQIWCLEAGNGHTTDFGYLWVPPKGDPVWVGACKLVAGRNSFGFNRDLATKEISETIWVNYPIPDTAGDQPIYVYTYDVATGMLTIETKFGRWTKGNPWTFALNANTKNNTKKQIKPGTSLKDLRAALGGCACGDDALASLDPDPEVLPGPGARFLAEEDLLDDAFVTTEPVVCAALEAS